MGRSRVWQRRILSAEKKKKEVALHLYDGPILGIDLRRAADLLQHCPPLRILFLLPDLFAENSPQTNYFSDISSISIRS